MATVLITDPAHDEATQVLSGWIQSVAGYITSLKSKGHTIIGLNNSDVTKANLQQAVDDNNPNLIMINGHGTSDVLFGHNDHPIIESSETGNSRFNNSIIHALACAAARNLGSILVAEGATSFIGYNEDFHFYHNVKPGDDPTKDPMCALFLEPAYDIPKSLADGLTVAQAFSKSQTMYQLNLLSALKGNVPQTVLASLFHDIQSHVVLGDQDSTI